MRAPAIAIASVLLLACAELQGRIPFLPQPGSGGFTEEELRVELADFAARFELVVGLTAERIAELSPDRKIRRRTLVWRMSLPPLVHTAAFDPDPQVAYVTVLTVIVMMRQYLTSGGGRESFGEHQAIAVAAATRLEGSLHELGERFLNPAELTQIIGEVEEFTRARPIEGPEFAIQTVGATLAEVERSRTFDWVVGLPMTPFRALEGVGSTPAAVREFNVTALQFVRVAESLPKQIRWQAELLLYDIEDRDTVVQGISSLDLFAQSAQRLSDAAARLPVDVGNVLSDSRSTLTELERTLASARELAAPLERTAEHVRFASDSWATLLRDEAVPGRDPAEPGFDVRDFESTAREIGAAAGELRALVVELRALLASPDLNAAFGGATSTVDRADAHARGLIDAITWRLLGVLVAFFALLLAYRWLAPRIAGRGV